MKLILKILAAPVVIVLTPIIWICAGALYISSWVFGLAGIVVGILGVASLLLVSWQNGVILLVAAFLVLGNNEDRPAQRENEREHR